MIDEWFTRKIAAVRGGVKPSFNDEPALAETAPSSSEKKSRSRDYSVALSAQEWANVESFMARPGKEKTNASSCLDGELTVGANAELVSADIIQCRVLRVFGTLDAPIFAQKLILEKGAKVKSTARVGAAELHGTFEGTLQVHGTMAIAKTGAMLGKARALKFVVAEGGKLEGDVKRVVSTAQPDWIQHDKDDAWVDSFPTSMMSMTLRKQAA
ncbi:MAG: bactofilin family protein [Casimicrobium sp.]